MCNFSAEGSIVHEEDIEILDVVYDKLFKAIGEIKFGGIV